jgi:hypothetical protein
MTTQPAQVHQLPQPGVPAFEGQQVDAVTIKISGLSSLDSAENLVVGVDDRVRCVGEFKVTGVRHYVDKDGNLVREQTMKPITVTTCPWDPTDPHDDGVVRARPRP